MWALRPEAGLVLKLVGVAIGEYGDWKAMSAVDVLRICLVIFCVGSSGLAGQWSSLRCEFRDLHYRPPRYNSCDSWECDFAPSAFICSSAVIWKARHEVCGPFQKAA